MKEKTIKLRGSKFIGISGFARSGKDTFYERCKIHLEKEGKKVCRFAFADALKSECDELLSKYTDISAFTENKTEKEIVRPLLVSWGTQIRRELDQNCWIKKIQQDVIDKLVEGYYVFITDVRFKNEAEWVKMNGGLLVNIHREGIGPANHDEHTQSHFFKKLVSHKIHWPTFGEGEIEKCDEFTLPFLNHVLRLNSQPEMVL
jgi:hypothetical protein